MANRFTRPICFSFCPAALRRKFAGEPASFPLPRIENMKIAVIAGDGTGPEVTAEALKVLQAVSQIDDFSYELTDLDWGMHGT